MNTNFDITIGEKAGAIYPVVATYAPLAQTTDQLVIDPKAQPLASLVAWADGAVAANSANPDQADELGQELYKALFGGKLGEFLRIALQDADGKHASLRLRLSSNDLSVLSLPWEFLYDSQRGRLFATDENTPLVRYLSEYATFGAVQGLQTRLPLRMLMIVPAVPDLDVQGEIDLVREALRQENLLDQRISMTILGGPHETVTIERLREFLQEDAEGFDIWHFSGHGDTDGGRGNLRFNDAAGGEQWISSGVLGRLLKRYTQPQNRPRPMRLAVLNSCEGGISAPKAYGVRSLLGMAPALIQNGFAAVIAMQYKILDTASLTFAKAFYRALTRDTTAGLVDAAVTNARGALAAEIEGHRSFATPVLFMHTAGGRIFELPEQSAEATGAPLSQPTPTVAARSVELTPAEEDLLRQRRFETPSSIEQEIGAKRRLLTSTRFNSRYWRQQIQEMAASAPPYLHSQANQAEADIARYEQELEGLIALQEAVDKAVIPAEMLLGDYLNGRLSGEALALFMRQLQGDFDDAAVISLMRQQSPPFTRRVAQRLLQASEASDSQLASAAHNMIRAFVAQPGNGYISLPNGKYRRVR